MWLFAKNGFFSIVKDKNNPDNLLVRARVKGDIEQYWPNAKVEMTEDADYLYRTSLPIGSVRERVGAIVGGIDYPNFKAAASDTRRRGIYYHRVWMQMLFMQDDLREKP